MFKILSNIKTPKEFFKLMFINVLVVLFISLPCTLLYVDILRIVLNNLSITNNVIISIFGGLVPVLLSVCLTFLIGLPIYKKLFKCSTDMPTICNK